jgi:flagellar motor switch protein FliN/FliY
MSENSENSIEPNTEEPAEVFQAETVVSQEEQPKPPERAVPHIAPVREPSPPDAGPEITSANLGMLMNVSLQLTVELGRSSMSVRQVLDLQKGAVVELDRIAGEAVDVYVNDRMIARGDVVVVDDKFGVRITEIVNPNPIG